MLNSLAPASNPEQQKKIVAYLRGGSTFGPPYTALPHQTIEGTSVGQFRLRPSAGQDAVTYAPRRCIGAGLGDISNAHGHRRQTGENLQGWHRSVLSAYKALRWRAARWSLPLPTTAWSTCSMRDPPQSSRRRRRDGTVRVHAPGPVPRGGGRGGHRGYDGNPGAHVPGWRRSDLSPPHVRRLVAARGRCRLRQRHRLVRLDLAHDRRRWARQGRQQLLRARPHRRLDDLRRSHRGHQGALGVGEPRCRRRAGRKAHFRRLARLHLRPPGHRQGSRIRVSDGALGGHRDRRLQQPERQGEKSTSSTRQMVHCCRR